MLVGQDTDLTFSIDGRVFINDDGHYNFPGGEFFTGPVEDSVNGTFAIVSQPLMVGDLWKMCVCALSTVLLSRLRAAQGQDYLDKMLSLDEGARRLGEFAFGNNRNVDRCTKNILFDEKMGGTVHLALGASIPQTLWSERIGASLGHGL